MPSFDQQLAKIKQQPGFIAALDQSGGSTPKALRLYDINEGDYANDEEMYALVHQMRERIVTSEVFDGQRILGAILFENTLDRDFAGKNAAQFLWEDKQIVPFLKVDKGLADELQGVQLMKPIDNLAALLKKAKERGVFGTKMRSLIKQYDADGITKVVAQQFELGEKILAAGLVPIIEPEVDIHSHEKAAIEEQLKAELLTHLDQLPAHQCVMLKLTLPEHANFYRELMQHPQVLKVVALSGGYTREEADQRLTANEKMIASFSRALTEGLSAQQTDDEFNLALNAAIESIYTASMT
ncbi:MAG: fructose bisphosphate aldolase [Pseudomonadales bacterium]|nr:fructose bisphosphate aldolase [Pseudomonadales bacterium]MDG2078146.1 fructose bisphosphate aldolase [Pseudomonadales bacterium]